MDRVAAMGLMLVMSLLSLLLFLALFAVAPIFCSLSLALGYTLYLFLANEKAGVHNAQEFENRFWVRSITRPPPPSPPPTNLPPLTSLTHPTQTVFALMVASIAMFTIDSPVAIGTWSPSLGFLITVSFGWLVHAYDRHLHRLEMSRVPNLRRSSSLSGSIARMRELGVPVEEQLRKVNEALSKIDMMVMPSTINNIVNARYIMEREKEIISVLSEAEPPALNFLATRLKLGLLFYKVKDHRAENGQVRGAGEARAEAASGGLGPERRSGPERTVWAKRLTERLGRASRGSTPSNARRATSRLNPIQRSPSDSRLNPIQPPPPPLRLRSTAPTSASCSP
jgi:hypothetical protein